MLGNFNLPSVDHLREGVDYSVLDWDFTVGQPPTPGEGCDPGERVVFGICRKVRSGSSGEKEFDSGNKSKQEQGLEAEASKQGSSFQNNKAVTTGGKKYGWAMKDGKPVMIEWGSLAGTKPKPKASPAAGAQPPAATATSPTPQPR